MNAMKQKRFIQFRVAYLSIVFLFWSCHKKDPSTPTISNSNYKNAFMTIGKYRYVHRAQAGQDSTYSFLSIGAGVGDSSNVTVFTKIAGSISINDFGLPGPNFLGNYPWPYYYQETNATDSSISRFDDAHWRVKSPNGIVDMDFDAGSTAYYQDTMPYAINRSAGFTVRVNPTNSPNADSVRITINGLIDTSVAVSSGDVSFSPATLSVLLSTNTWGCNIVIYLIKQNEFSTNDRGFKVSSDRYIEYNVNVN